MTTFANPAPVVPRDGYKRPLIKQPDGTIEPYTRVSTFAKALDDGYGLMVYKLRLLALGLGRREDLAAIAAGLTYERGQELDELIDVAIDFAGGTAKANHGTAIHLLTEPDAPEFVPARMVDDITAYREAHERKRITIVETERFVVNDEFKVAGTFDHIVNHRRYGNVVEDKKTGKLRWLSHEIQEAMYATGKYYDPETGERSDLPDINTDVGIVAHIPAGGGQCDLYPVDLTIGLATARLAAFVTLHRDRVRTMKPTPLDEDETDTAIANLVKGGLIADPIAAEISAAQSYQQLDDVWRSNKSRWTDEHTEAAKKRLAALSERASA